MGVVQFRASWCLSLSSLAGLCCHSGDLSGGRWSITEREREREVHDSEWSAVVKHLLEGESPLCYRLRHLVAVGWRGCCGVWNCESSQEAFEPGAEVVPWSFGASPLSFGG